MTQQHNNTTTDPNMVFMYCVVVRCLKKKNIPSRTPPTNGTPLPLCAIFRITLLVGCLKKKNSQSKTPPKMVVFFSRYSSHWSILTSCQCLKKKNIWSIAPPTMEHHFCFTILSGFGCHWLMYWLVVNIWKRITFNQELLPQWNATYAFCCFRILLSVVHGNISKQKNNMIKLYIHKRT